MKITTLALACSLLGTAAFAQDEKTAPAPAPAIQPEKVMAFTFLVKDQPPFMVSLGVPMKGATITSTSKTVTTGEKTVILEGGVTVTMKQDKKVLWNISVPEGSVAIAAPAPTVQPEKFATFLVKGQPPLLVSLNGEIRGTIEFTFSAKTITEHEETTTYEDDVMLTVKQDKKVLWSISVPEGSVTLLIGQAAPTQALKK